MPRDSFNSIKGQLLKSKKVLVSGHLNPDFDSFGASLGLYFLLEDLGKKVFLGTEFKGALWSEFREELSRLSYLDSAKTVDLAVLIDYGDKARLPEKVRRVLERSQPVVISIDHHSHQTQFGEILWVDSRYCSVSEMVYQLMKNLDWQITDKIASYLLLGIIGDTGGFSYYPLTPKRLNILKDLIRAGGEEYPHFFNLTKKWLNFEDLIKFGHYLRKVKLVKELDFAYLFIDFKAEESYFYNRLVAQLNLIEGVKVSLLLLKLSNGLIKGELRGSSANRVDLSQLASLFGGGGHFNAAGFTTDAGSVKIISTFRKILQEANN